MHILKSISRPALCRTALFLLCLFSLIPASAQEATAAADSVPVTRENLIATWGTKAEGMTIGLRLAEDSTAKFVVTITEEEQLQGTIRIVAEGTWWLADGQIKINFDVNGINVDYAGGQSALGEQLSEMVKEIMFRQLGQKTEDDGTITASFFICGLTKDTLSIGIDSYDEPLTLRRARQR